MTILKARQLTRGQVHDLLGFQPLFDGSFASFLALKPLTANEALAVNPSKAKENQTALWILVVESKNSEASESNGVAQMLTYADQSLEYQESVWGLVTNGLTYQFFYIRQGQPFTSQFMPALSLFERDRAAELLQVLKAIVQP
jgi:hypothetical protein